MPTKQIENVPHWDEVYNQVLGLYAALMEADNFRVKRAEMRQGECQAEGIDFCADVQLKAARTVLFDEYAKQEWEKVLRSPQNYRFLPIKIREAMGENFESNHLGVNGDYRTLYARTKQERT